MGVCQDTLTLCTTDQDCGSSGAHVNQCQVCAVELNTDDNSRLEFNAPRDLIGFERHEHYVGTFYNPDWSYGHLCRDVSDEDACLLRNMGEGSEGAANFANLGLSLIGHGKLLRARQYIEHSATLGDSPRSVLAARVYALLQGVSDEPVPIFGPPVPAPQMSAELRAQVAETFREVMDAVNRQHWPQAMSALEQIPATVRRSSGPDMAFLTAYLLFKSAMVEERPNQQYYREAARILQDLVRLEESYVRSHPEIYYFLARCYRLDYSYDRARRFMVTYVEAVSDVSTSEVENDEPQGGISDAQGASPKDVHPDYGGARTVEPSPDEELQEDDSSADDA
jgi:hypothetical protein